MALRMIKLMRGGNGARSKAERMVCEKIDAAVEAAASHLRRSRHPIVTSMSGRAGYWTTSSLTFATPPPTIPSVSAAA